MCFTVHPKHKEAKTAKKDIRCYKILDTDESNLLSPQASFRYTLNKINEPISFEPTIKWGYRIDEGYHSFSNKKVIRATEGAAFACSVCNYPQIFICIIPKGTKYYYNPERKEYVSEQIIINKKL